jgi:hypothetical protein
LSYGPLVPFSCDIPSFKHAIKRRANYKAFPALTFEDDIHKKDTIFQVCYNSNYLTGTNSGLSRTMHANRQENLINTPSPLEGENCNAQCLDQLSMYPGPVEK